MDSTKRLNLDSEGEEHESKRQKVVEVPEAPSVEANPIQQPPKQFRILWLYTKTDSEDLFRSHASAIPNAFTATIGVYTEATAEYLLKASGKLLNAAVKVRKANVQNSQKELLELILQRRYHLYKMATLKPSQLEVMKDIPYDETLNLITQGTLKVSQVNNFLDPTTPHAYPVVVTGP